MSDEERIAAFVVTRFRAALRRNEVGVDEPLVSSGVIDSFGVLEVLAFLESTFGVTLDPAQHELTELETVRHMAALVERARHTA